MKKSLVINLYGGPGTGKSRTTARIFSNLKWKDIDCEMALEYAKDKVWENSIDVLNNQVYIFGKQYHKLFVLKDKVDVIITDSPILLTIIYDKKQNINLKNLVLDSYNEFENINVFIKRVVKYNPNGRMQTEKEAHEKDNEIKKLLIDNNIPYFEIEGTLESIDKFTEEFVKKYF